MRILLGFLGGLLLLSACEEENGPVFVRLVNGSDVTFDQVLLYGVPEYQDLGTLTPGDTSLYYQSFSEIGHPVMVLRVGTDTVQSVCILSDKLPPPPLETGYHTFEITLVEIGDRFLYASRVLP